jgi:hypothetical protein
VSRPKGTYARPGGVPMFLSSDSFGFLVAVVVRVGDEPPESGVGDRDDVVLGVVADGDG